MGLALLKSEVSQSDVEVAWATYRAVILAEVDDPSLQDDATHQLAISRAKARFQLLFDDWSSRC
jgi:hypothetical protein